MAPAPKGADAANLLTRALSIIMKVYVAAPFERKQEVLDLYRLLKKKGHSISFDWTVHRQIKPFTENLEIARRDSIEDINGVKDSDLFILLSATEGSRA